MSIITGNVFPFIQVYFCVFQECFKNVSHIFTHLLLSLFLNNLLYCYCEWMLCFLFSHCLLCIWRLLFFVLILYHTILLTYVIISIRFITDSLRVSDILAICHFFIYQQFHSFFNASNWFFCSVALAHNLWYSI